MIKARTAKFQIGQIVRHRIFSFRGVIFDIDPEFNNTEEWWLSIPEGVRPHKDQPFYHLLAENSETEYVAYVSEQNLLRQGQGGRLPSTQFVVELTQPTNFGKRPTSTKDLVQQKIWFNKKGPHHRGPFVVLDKAVVKSSACAAGAQPPRTTR
jgi:heat shock protein HspQ